MNPLLSDPWVVAQIDLAIAPYVGRLSASDIAWMREQLAETLSSDEDAAAALRGAMPREVDESGEVVRGTVQPAVKAPAKVTRARRRGR